MIFSLFDEISFQRNETALFAILNVSRAVSFQRNETALDTFKIAKWFVADDNDNLTLLLFSEILIFMIN